MLHKVESEKSLQYIEPENITLNDYIKCETKKHFKFATHFTLVPEETEEGWSKVYYFIRRDELFDRLEGGEGYVYILECPNQPGVLKVGETERTPQERLREINGAPGVIMPWIINSAFPCKSPRAVEQLVHLELASCRINSQKEGFAIFPEKAKEVILNVIKRYGAEIEDHKPRDYRKEKKYWFLNEKR